MNKKWIFQQPLFLSIIIHSVLALIFLVFFSYGNKPIQEIPIEITEFIRHLGEPKVNKSQNSAKKNLEQKSSTPSTDGSTNKPLISSPAATSSENGEAVSEDYEVSEMPILLNEVRIPYPPEARTKKIQGNVVFDLLISSDGKVREAKAVSSPDAMLTDAAQKAVLLFKFRPARMSDKSVAIRIRYTYRFLLQ